VPRQIKFRLSDLYSDNKEKAKDKIWYWLKQPVPVFLVAVPDMRNINSNPLFFICRVQDFYPGKRSRKPHDAITSSWKIDKQGTLSSFLNSQLKIEAFEWDLMHRKIGFLREPGYRYVKTLMQGFSAKYEDDLRRGVQNILYTLANDTEKKVYLHALEELIVTFHDRHHYYWKLMGRYYEIQSDLTKALKYYRESLDIIDDDPKLKNQPEKQQTKFDKERTWLEEKINSVKSSDS